MTEKKQLSVIRGSVNKEKYNPPAGILRDNYIYARNREARETNYMDFMPMNNAQLIHLDRVDTIDFYPEDMRLAMNLFLKYYGKGTLMVVVGFRSAALHGLSAHSIGMAIDILADNKTHALKICNAAYRAGFPNIVLGGDFDIDNGYVHLDITPKGDFAYNSGIYTGPWS